jgi:hypothetical protein
MARPGTLPRGRRLNAVMSDWAPHTQQSITRWIGDLFRVRSEDATREHLPERWIELIQYLNDKEHNQQSSRRPEQT